MLGPSTHTEDRPVVAGEAPAATSPYDVVDPVVVRRILEAMCSRRAMLTVHPRGSRESFVTQLLHVDAGGVVLDCASRQEHDDLLLTAPSVRLEGRDGDVPVVFVLATPSRGTYQRHPAVAAPLPAVLQRVQRRGHFRVHVPRSRPTHCWLPPEAGGERARVRVVDLSCGGLSLAADFDVGSWPLRQVRGPCELRIPGEEALLVQLQAVRTFREYGHVAPILACRFVGLAGTAEQAVQRYVNALQRDPLHRR